MSRLTRIAVIAALLTAPVIPIVTAASADAAPLTHAVVPCGPWRITSCVAVADNDEGRLVIRDALGHRHALTSGVSALRYLHAHHFRPCAQEDSAACYWDAGHRGNRVGDSFIVIGGHAEGTGTVWYLGNLD